MPRFKIRPTRHICKNHPNVNPVKKLISPISKYACVRGDLYAKHAYCPGVTHQTIA